MPRAIALALVLAVLVAAAACDDSSEPEAAADGGALDFCAAAEAFAEAEAATLEGEDTPEGRRAAALASVEAYAALAAAAPADATADAETALEGKRGVFDTYDQIGWGEDALNSVEEADADELLTDLDRFFGDEYFDAEQAVIARVRDDCDAEFLAG